MQNMKSFKFAACAALCAAALASCTSKAVIEGSFAAAPADGKVTVKMMEGSALKTLDTLTLSSKGGFRYDFPVQKGRPEFVYLYCGETKVSSLLLAQGDRVRVQCDTAGFWSVEGSQDCQALLQMEKDLSQITASETITLQEYVAYYRKMVKYVLSNSRSLTVVPAFFQKIGDTPVFAQATDAILMSSVADSLSGVYPESRWISVLRSEAAARERQLSLQAIIASAGDSSYPDLFLPDIKGQTVQLSSVALKATLVVFWDASLPENKIYNNDVLLPLYKQFNAAGLQIYAVCPTSDKPAWAMVVREQNAPWINVCDTKGRSLGTYGVTQVPSLYLVSDKGLEKLSDISLSAVSKAVRAAL